MRFVGAIPKRSGWASAIVAVVLALTVLPVLYGQPPAAEGSVLVHFSPGADRGPLRAFAAQNGGRVQYEYGILPNVVNLRGIPSGLVGALQNIPGVVRVEPDAVATSYLGESVARIQALQTQISSFGVNGSGVRVCILDGGIDALHPMFGSRVDLQSGWDFANNDSNPADDSGHGTHVSAIVGGQSGSGYPQGVAPGATIIPIKVLNNGSGSFSNVIAGIDYCAGSGVNGQGNRIPTAAKVINMSLGGGQFSGTCDSDSAAVASNNAVDRGLVVVAASGNNGYSSAMGTPACGSKVIAVGSTYDANYSKNFSWCTATNRFFCTQTCTDSNPAADQVGCFSNKGSQLDVVAPGCEISSAKIGGGLTVMCGTSMAAPHVAGLAALLLQLNPGLPPVDPGNGALNIRNCIRQGAEDKGASGFDPAYGYGRINAMNSLNLCQAGGSVNQPPTANFTFTCTGLTCSFTSTSTDSDGSIAGSSWNFGDNTSGTGTNPGHTYAASGTYNVVLTVTDDDGATGQQTRSVTVSSPSGGITLNASGYKVKGQQKADLTWSGATQASVDVYRSGIKIATTANSGAYTDNINRNGNGSYEYQVCDVGSTSCSNKVTVVF
jgi:subtilisin family serine protease